mgnify:CR=1 FL=1
MAETINRGDTSIEAIEVAFDMAALPAAAIEEGDWLIIDEWLKSNNEKIPRVDWNDNPIHHTIFPNDEVGDICIKLESLTLAIRSYDSLKKKNYPVWLWCLGQDNSGWSYTAVCVDNNDGSAILVMSEKGHYLGYL